MNNKMKTHKRTFLQFNFIKLAFYLFILLVIGFSIYAAIPVLKAVVIAFIIAYLINPLVDFFERKQVSRLMVTMIIFSVFILLLVALIFLVKTAFPSAAEISALKRAVIESLIDLQVYLQSQYSFIEWSELFLTLTANVNSGSDLTNQLPAILSSLASMSSLFLIIPFCIFFFLLNGRIMKKKLLSMIPNKYFEMTLITLRDVDYIFGSYIRGTLLESLITGVLTLLGFFMIGFPFSTALITGSIAGLANAIPYVGPLIGLLLGVSVCVLQLIPGSFTSFLGIKATIIGVVFVVIIVQTLDNIIIKPTVIGRSVNLHPLVVILGVMAGSHLFGFIGLLAAIPFIAIVKVIITTLYKQLKGFNLLSDHLFSIMRRDIS